MGTGFPWSIYVTKIIFDELVVLGSDVFHELGMNITIRGEAVEVVYDLGI